MKKILFSKATKWSEAFPAGNGHLGIMYYGGVTADRLDLSENTFFSGEYKDPSMEGQSAEAFRRMREQVEENNYREAHKTAEAFIPQRGNYGTNLPVGTLYIEYEGLKQFDNRYERSLDIVSGVIQAKDDQSRRTCFVSHPDRIAVYHFENTHRVNAAIIIKLRSSEGKVVLERDKIRFSEDAYEELHCNHPTGVHLEGCIAIDTDGIAEGNNIRNMTYLTLFIGMKTDFQNDDSANCLYEKNVVELTKALRKGYSELIETHIRDFSGHMSRCSLEIKGSGYDEQISFMFQYGRYLLLCSSREDSVLPAHLQGIWNDDVACRIGWTCDMHLDINTQMNYWISSVTSLPETTTPLFRWITDSLIPHGKICAKHYYGLEGWCAEIVSNAWGYAEPYWAVPIAPMPTGGAWIMTHMWNYYSYFPDDKFLENVMYPAYLDAVRFFRQYVFLTKEGYSSGPSISPENSFQIGEERFYISNGCTYEITLIREVFTEFLNILEILKRKNSEKYDAGLYEQISSIAGKLLPYRVESNGTIAEWEHAYPSYDPQHRHTSHVLGLYPYDQISRDEESTLGMAAQKTITERLTPEDGWEDTGWARSMLILYEARLHNSKKAYDHIKHMMDHLVVTNGMVIHPPTRGAYSFDNVYELDGNTGLTAGITEMLLQSRFQTQDMGSELRPLKVIKNCFAAEIDVLPALPAEWKEGEIKGLHAVGRISAAIKWNSRSVTVELLAEKEIKYHLFLHGKRTNLSGTLSPGIPMRLELII